MSEWCHAFSVEDSLIGIEILKHAEMPNEMQERISKDSKFLKVKKAGLVKKLSQEYEIPLNITPKGKNNN